MVVLFVKLKKKETESQPTTMNGNQPREYMELSPLNASAYTSLIVSDSPTRGNSNLHEYEEVTSPASNTDQYETVQTHQSNN